MFFPKYSNIYPELKEVLYNRAAQTTNVYQQGGVSGLTSWIRVISSVEVGDTNGLVMQSIHGGQNFDSVYGNNEKPGMLGYALDMKTPVEIDGIGRGLRPSPIITGVSINEMARGSLKQTEFTVKCFTKEQMNKLQKFLLEPGFHILVECGWNVADSYNQRIGGGGEIDPCQMAAYDNWNVVREKRKLSNYQYDATLGIVVGGGVAFADGETYELKVKISGAGIAAEYMQTHRGGNSTDSAGDGQEEPFPPENVGKSTPGQQLFKQMFNSLPKFKQSSVIKKWSSNNDKKGNNWAYEGNYVNFDEVARDTLSEALQKGTTITNKGGDSVKIPTNVEIFDKERFIRFELAVEILNDFIVDLESQPSDCPDLDTKNLTINIKDTPIKAFPHMWSTDKSTLYIPNTTAPNFSLKKSLWGEPGEEINYINYDDLNNNDNIANLHPLVEEAPSGDERAEKNGSANDPATGQSRPVPFAFPCLYDLDESVITHDCDDTVLPLTEKRGFWGWLKDLYINYDFFVECLNKPNFNTRDVLYEMLNGLSSGCNSLWDFQIMEQPKTNDPKGPAELRVVDFNFTGKTEPDDEDMATFQTRGTQSPFTSVNFNMSVQGAMMSSIMIKKMSKNKKDASGDSPPIMFGSVFDETSVDRVGTILMRQQLDGQDSESDSTDAADEEGEPTEEETAKAKAFEVFAQRAGLFSRYQDRKQVLSGVGKDGTTENVKEAIETLLCIGTWNDPTALKSVELIDRGLKEAAVSGEQSKSDNNSQNPPLGLAQVDFTVHGVSGFKVGDKVRFDGIPDKYGYPNFFQVMKVGHSISGNQWFTDVKTEMRMIGTEE